MPTERNSKTPSHIAYQVREAKDGKRYWTRIGSAWAHTDGQGYNLQLEAVPLDGAVTLRILSEAKD